MKKTNLFMTFMSIMLVFGLVFMTSCGGGDEANEEDTEEENEEEEEVEEEEIEEEAKVELKPGKTPFDFPTVSTRAKEGFVVLTPSYKMWKNKLAKEDPTKETYIFYKAKMAEPGEIESVVEFTFDGKQKMPNSMLIPIWPNQTAKEGDVVLTWWQTGSGMQRAIVTDASNPKEPKVRYLDLSWDHPSKDRETGKSIGQTEYQLKPDTFVKVNAFSPGSAIAAKDGSKWNATTVVSMTDEKDIMDRKILTIGFAGKMKVYDRKDCYMIPTNPKVKAGDKVKAVFVGSYKDATVTRVDDKMGVVFVKFENINDEKPVSFGEITKTLPN